MSSFDDYDTVCSVQNHKSKSTHAFGYSLRTILKLVSGGLLLVLSCLVCNCCWLTVCIFVVVFMCCYLMCICFTMCVLLFFFYFRCRTAG